MAGFQWISRVARETAARGLMIDHLTLSIYTTRTHAWILALIVYTSLRMNTV